MFYTEKVQNTGGDCMDVVIPKFFKLVYKWSEEQQETNIWMVWSAMYTIFDSYTTVTTNIRASNIRSMGVK